MKKSFIKRITTIAAATAIAITGFTGISHTTTAYAADSNGTHINYDGSKYSDVLVIGDSRVEMAGEVDKTLDKKVRWSWNGTVGAHYLYDKAWVTGKWKNKPMVIGSDKYLEEQKKIIENCLKKHGSCTVVISATDNDMDYNNWIDNSINRMVKLKNELKKVKVNGETATFYFASMIPDKNKDATVKKFNKALKAKVKDEKIGYIDMGLNDTWKGKYAGDNTHFTTSGSKQFKKIILTTIGENGEITGKTTPIKTNTEKSTGTDNFVIGGAASNWTP